MQSDTIITTPDITIMKGVTYLNINIIDFDEKSIKYEIQNTPICQYDQHSRARVGVKFLNYKVAEKPEYVMYSNVFDKLLMNNEFLSKFISISNKIESARMFNGLKETYNLMSRNCSYEVIQDFSSLQGQMNRRLKFCEEEFIVGLHWLLRHKMIKANIQIAEKFLPGCDIIKSCDYSSADYLSNMFGCLFAGCGRWPDKNIGYTSFNQSCTNIDELKKQLNIDIPLSNHQL